MADTKQPSRSLTYKINEVATVKADCERFIAYSKASTGSFQTAGKVRVDHEIGSAKKFRISFEKSITGKPKESGEEKIAFVASCRVECVIEFDKDQDDKLPESLLNELTMPIFYVATERCRNLVVGMGYPAPVIGVMPMLVERTEQLHKKVGASKPVRRTPKPKPVTESK